MMTEVQKDRHMNHEALFTTEPCPQCLASIARDGEGHGHDCADDHEACENNAPCRTPPDWQGGEPPDIYHECGSSEHHILPKGDIR